MSFCHRYSGLNFQQFRFDEIVESFVSSQVLQKNGVKNAKHIRLNTVSTYVTSYHDNRYLNIWLSVVDCSV